MPRAKAPGRLFKGAIEGLRRQLQKHAASEFPKATMSTQSNVAKYIHTDSIYSIYVSSGNIQLFCGIASPAVQYTEALALFLAVRGLGHLICCVVASYAGRPAQQNVGLKHPKPHSPGMSLLFVLSPPWEPTAPSTPPRTPPGSP